MKKEVINKKIKFRKTTIFALFFYVSFASFVFAQSQSGMSFLTDAGFLKDLSGAQGDLVALFNALYKIVLALASVYAVIMIAFYGAKYALVDSFTGKKGALENIWPIIYGLIALIGTYIIFNTISSGYSTMSFSAPAAQIQTSNNSTPTSVNAQSLISKEKKSVLKQLGPNTIVSDIEHIDEDKFCLGVKRQDKQGCKSDLKVLKDCVNNNINCAKVKEGVIDKVKVYLKNNTKQINDAKTNNSIIYSP